MLIPTAPQTKSHAPQAARAGADPSKVEKGGAFLALLDGLRAEKNKKPTAPTAEKYLAAQKSNLVRTSGKQAGDPRQAKAVSVPEPGAGKDKSPAKLAVDEVLRPAAAAVPAAAPIKEEDSTSRKTDRRRAEDRDLAPTGSMPGADGAASVLSAVKMTADALSRTAVPTRNAEKGDAEALKTDVRPGSSKQKDKRSAGLQLDVYDQRARTAAVDGAVRPQQNGKDTSPVGGQDADLVIRLRSGGGQPDTSADATVSKPSGNFQELLARELRENANADIVRQASLVLKDGGKGLIRLALQPESLGSVKIRLEMAENKIAGHIVVESDAALKAFERELRSLEQAFLDGGFDGASLDVSVSADSGRDGAPDRRQAESPKPFFSERAVAASYEVPPGAAVKIDQATGAASPAVNMLA